MNSDDTITSINCLAHDITQELSKDVKSGDETSFEDLMLNEKTYNGLRKCGFLRPSPIQLETIPIGRCGFDLIVQSKAGTGKTCIFTIIALENLQFNTKRLTQSLIIAPTREIAIQIHDVISNIGSCYEELSCALCIGGVGLHQDKEKLSKKPGRIGSSQIVIGTPGRIKQLIELNILKIQAIELLVLDEADKLMDDQFKMQIDQIFRHLTEEKQMIVTSATYPNKLAIFLKKYMRTPKFIRVGKELSLEAIDEQFIECKAGNSTKKTLENKFTLLKDILLKVEFKKCIIFTNFQARAPQIRDYLNKDKNFVRVNGITNYLCAELSQEQRTSVFRKFKVSDQKLLVSTDISARGIDIEGIGLVINLDLPHDNATYYHRIGRAGRFGRPGRAICIVSSESSDKFTFKKEIESEKMTELTLNDQNDDNMEIV